MTKIVCACVECKHHSDKNTCTAKKVKLSYSLVHTVYDGMKQFWVCNQYEESDFVKEAKKQIDEFWKGKVDE